MRQGTDVRHTQTDRQPPPEPFSLVILPSLSLGPSIRRSDIRPRLSAAHAMAPGVRQGRVWRRAARATVRVCGGWRGGR